MSLQAHNQATVHTPREFLRETWGFVETAGAPGPPEAHGVEIQFSPSLTEPSVFPGSALPLSGGLRLMMMLLGILMVLANT